MHGPNGANYRNENVFRQIEPDTKVVIEHLGARGTGSRLR